MTRNKILNLPMLLMAAMFVSFAGYQSVALRNIANMKPAIVATVDLERVFNQLEERTAADEDLTKMADELQRDGDRRAKAIDALEEELEVYTPGSEQHQELLNKLALASHEYRAFVEWGRRKIDVKKAATLRRIYSSIKDAIEREAKDKGYDIVFVNDSLSPIPVSDESETSRQISARRMLYSSPQIDITRDVIGRMNNEFRVAAGR